MKKILSLVIGLSLFYGIALADTSGYGVSLGYGRSQDDIDIYRLGIKKDFSTQWFENRYGYLTGYFELSYNRWEYHDDDINGVALSPVFVYCFRDEDKLIRPYIEGGIGAAYLDEYQIGSRNLATHFQFEDRIGAGVRIGMFDLNFRYMHYSNASIKQPNDGIDIWMFTTAIQF